MGTSRLPYLLPLPYEQIRRAYRAFHVGYTIANHKKFLSARTLFARYAPRTEGAKQ